ncbi:alpha/beta hydrolase [Sphingomonas canadensis]|uniref:Alpha/beta hydrolase n=1 Tax=Sphingomonas canadensis TaxID=1219257 RepID=A0ABW3H6X0_9SPHN|nr:alpha/beta fold hydrolase [Sphingomonas canadensis]MCW3835420.1 alpha/beta fold hydrolase [Sphingomonas canadensis]
MRSRLIALPLFAAGLALAGCAPHAGGPAGPGAPRPAPGLRLHVETFRTLAPRRVRTLVVVLHGDAAPGTRGDELAFAAASQQAVPDSAAVTILRPGYSDAKGNKSPGDPGNATGDSYDAPRLADVERTIARLRAAYPRARVVLVGDDGGAAIAANLAGLHPALVDGIVLAGCPCSLPEWRAHMAKRTGNKAWSAATASLDPLKTAGGVSPALRAAVLVGADDPLIPVRFARAYAESLVLRGVATDYRILPGKGHDLLGDPEVLAATVRLAASLPEKR